MMQLRSFQGSDGSSRGVSLNWRRQIADERDDAYRLKMHPNMLSSGMPGYVDLRPVCSPVEDQGDIGSCTANMLAGMVESLQIREALGQDGGLVLAPEAPPSITVSEVKAGPDGSFSYVTTVRPSPPPQQTRGMIDVSRLFQYYASRRVEGTVGEDVGVTMRGAMKAAQKYGLIDEGLWPYDTSRWDTDPDPVIWKAATKHKIKSYHAISDGDLTTVRSMIASGYLVGFGFNVYTYFLTLDMSRKAWLRRPAPSEALQGGHAAAFCGFDDVNRRLLVRNSWGRLWGLGGYFWMDYDYAGDPELAGDFWVVQASPI